MLHNQDYVAAADPLPLTSRAPVSNGRTDCDAASGVPAGGGPRIAPSASDPPHEAATYISQVPNGRPAPRMRSPRSSVIFMFTFLVLTMALVNVGLGFALAVHARRENWFPPVDESFVEALLAEVDAPPPPMQQPAVELPESPKVSEELPAEWLDVLDEAQHACGLVEASVHVLKLEVGRYRDHLIHIDNQVRACRTAPDIAVIQTCLAQLKTVNVEWLKKQGDATAHLQAKHAVLGDNASLGGGLEDILLEQTAQIETTISNLELLDFNTDVAQGCSRLIGEIRKLIDLAHSLRDRMQEVLLAILQQEGRLVSQDRRTQTDGLTGMYNRSGLETVLQQLWADDPQRVRQVSVALIDVDRLGKINEAHGALLGDKLLGCLGPLTREVVEKRPEFDILGRFSGQQFMVLFQDNGPQFATSAVERLRQTIQESSFHASTGDVAVTITAAVTEVMPRDTVQTLFARAAKTLRKAKAAGRNCTQIDTGAGPTPVAPPTFDVSPCSVELDD